MKKKLNGILTLLLVLVVQIAFAQTKTVTDSDGLPLSRVNILIEDIGTGTQTDFDGNYSICLVSNQKSVLGILSVKDELHVIN